MRTKYVFAWRLAKAESWGQIPSFLRISGRGGGRQSRQGQSYQKCQNDVAQKLESNLIPGDASQEAGGVQATFQHAGNLGDDSETFPETAAFGSHGVKGDLPNYQADQISAFLCESQRLTLVPEGDLGRVTEVALQSIVARLYSQGGPGE